MKERGVEWWKGVATISHSDDQVFSQPLGIASDGSGGCQSYESLTRAGVETHVSHGGLGCHNKVQLVDHHEDGVGFFVTETVTNLNLPPFNKVTQRLREGGGSVVA